MPKVGLEPTLTCVNRILSPAPCGPNPKADYKVTGTPPQPLAHTLAHEMQIDPDLARLIDAWPDLPPTVKRMILAALEAGGPGE